MKKLFIVGICLGVIGVGYWLLSPLWRTERVDESLPETTPLSSGDPSMVPRDQSPKSADVTTELFTGSFVGKCQCQYLRWIDSLTSYKVGNSRGNYRSFASTGTSNNQQWATTMPHNSFLSHIQAILALFHINQYSLFRC